MRSNPAVSTQSARAALTDTEIHYVRLPLPETGNRFADPITGCRPTRAAHYRSDDTMNYDQNSVITDDADLHPIIEGSGFHGCPQRRILLCSTAMRERKLLLQRYEPTHTEGGAGGTRTHDPGISTTPIATVPQSPDVPEHGGSATGQPTPTGPISGH